jgi:GntR family transcriptional regulator, transcriptional repressor for pyruvate dehydrogenase complex
VTYEPVRRESVAAQVFASLRDAILSGVHAPGDALPAERELAARFGVNRQAVREAVGRLAQVRLVRVSQGGNTRVEDWRRTAGLDIAAQLAGSADRLAVATLTRDMLEMRALVGSDAARLCAERADEPARATVRALAEDYARIGADLDALAAANIDLWRAIVLGSRNVAYLLSFNSLVAHALAIAPVPAERRTAELLDVPGHLRLARLVEAGDGPGAYDQAGALLGRSIDAADVPDGRS